MTLTGGSYHDADSSAATFRLAAGLALQAAARKAGPVRLEPIVRLDITAPLDHVEIMRLDLARRGARLLSQERDRATEALTARAALPE